MNIILKLGQWIEKRFPEKFTLDQVKELIKLKSDAIDAMFAEINVAISFLELEVSKIKSEIETLKTQVTVKSRVVGSTPSNMTPFATRLPPVHPNGGNESPR